MDQSIELSWSFTEPFTKNAQKLYNLLFVTELNRDELISQLKTGLYTVDDINMAAYMYVENCIYAEGDAYEKHLFDDIPYGSLVPGIESSHLVESIQILLDYGLDPNKVFFYHNGAETNIMEKMMYVHNGYQSAEAATAMLTHGGNPSLIIEETSLIRELNFELLFYLANEEIRYFVDALVHYWMVFIGYGAKLEDGSDSVDPVDGFDISNFRNHRQYYYGAIHSEHSNDGMELCFFDKDTNWEVARY